MKAKSIKIERVDDDKQTAREMNFLPCQIAAAATAIVVVVVHPLNAHGCFEWWKDGGINK
jgi:hypothetical protein